MLPEFSRLEPKQNKQLDFAIGQTERNSAAGFNQTAAQILLSETQSRSSSTTSKVSTASESVPALSKLSKASDSTAKVEDYTLSKPQSSFFDQPKLIVEGFVSGLATSPLNGLSQLSNKSFGTNFKPLQFANQSEIDTSISGNIGKMVGTSAAFIALALATRRVMPMRSQLLSESVAFGTAGAIQGGVLTPTRDDLKGSSFFLARGGEALLGSTSAVLGAQSTRVANVFRAQAPQLGLTGSRLLALGAEATFNGALGAGTAHAYSLMQTGKVASGQEVATSTILAAGIGLGASALSFRNSGRSASIASDRPPGVRLASAQESSPASATDLRSTTSGDRKSKAAFSLATKEMTLEEHQQLLNFATGLPRWRQEAYLAGSGATERAFIFTEPPMAGTMVNSEARPIRQGTVQESSPASATELSRTGRTADGGHRPETTAQDVNNSSAITAQRDATDAASTPKKDSDEPAISPARISMSAAEFKTLLVSTDIKDVPKNIDVNGNLDFEGMRIFALPEGLHVGGDLDLKYTPISALPEGLHVGGNLDLEYTQISSLPEGLHVDGGLNLIGTEISSLPEGLHVGGYLDLRNTQISALPLGLHVGGDLSLYGTPISALPEGLHVGGNLDLADTPVSALPEGLHVGGDLSLYGTPISALPEGLHVSGDLDLAQTPISSLPEGLHVGGDLDLADTPISSLPEGLHVGGNLDLADTPISALPEGLHVGGEVLIGNTALAPENVLQKAHPNLSALHSANILKTIQESYGIDDINSLTQKQLSLVTAQIRSLKSKTFQSMIERLENGDPDSSSWSTRSALGLVSTFGNDSGRWLDIQSKAGRSLHDASFWLPINSPAELSGLNSWLHKNYKFSGNGAETLRPLDELSFVAQNWAGLDAEQRQLRYKELLSLVKSRKYLNQADEVFASESARWGISPGDYKGYEDRYLGSLSTKVPFPVEQRWREGDLTGRFLPRNDARGLYLGQHSDCCQHPKGMGASSAWYGQEAPNSGFFVVENKAGEVVAQSWAWISDDGAVVFDNVEGKVLGERDTAVGDIYQKVGNYLAQSHHKVTIGSGGSDLNLSRWKSTDKVPLPRDYSAYSDASSQVLLAQNPGIKPAPPKDLDNWVQSLRDSDKADMTRIAKAVYPEGWQFASEGEFGLALKDKDRGTIGYATIDRANREVTDIAILPEHRNKSRMLINALIDQVRRVGGVWSADFRESSSYKVLKAYEKWGRVEILEDSVSNIMGSDDMHSVRFKLE
ncbi:MAG: hypothetical protein SFV17_03995 [Candidatus Obscuribacter sp.]|nr:hypothetical protein [Candidatus Obscuribacter sp.]